MPIKKYFVKKLCLKIHQDLDFEHFYKGTVKRISGNDVTHSLSFLNRSFHQISCDTYKTDVNNKIVMAWCSKNEGNNGFIHFLNYNKKTKTYIDNTLGGESIYYIYFIFDSKWVQKKANNELPNPSEWLSLFRRDMYLKYCKSWVWKLFVTENDI